MKDLSFSSADIERIVCNNLEKREVKKVLNKLHKKKNCDKKSEEVKVREVKAIEKVKIELDTNIDVKALVAKEMQRALENITEMIKEEKDSFKEEIEEEIKTVVEEFSLQIVGAITETKEEVKAKIEELAKEAVDKVEKDLKNMGYQVSCDGARDKIIEIIKEETEDLKNVMLDELKRGVGSVEEEAKKGLNDLKVEVENRGEKIEEAVRNKVINLKESVTTNIKVEEIIKRNIEQIEKFGDVTNFIQEILEGIEEIRGSWVFRETEFLNQFLMYLEGEVNIFLKENIGVEDVNEFREKLFEDYKEIREFVNDEKEKR